MANIELRSRQAIIGPMIARILAETDLNDLTRGSFLLTLIEAAGSSDFITEQGLLKVLRMRDIDKTSGVDLENLGIEMGVSPKIGATNSTVLLTIGDSAFLKISSNVYAGSTAPTSGDTSINIVEGAEFPSSGTIYIGRGTKTNESIDYISIANAGSYWTLTLASPLAKDHLVGEEVVLAQGGDRIIQSGTTAISDGGGINSISFNIQSDYVLLDGEDEITGVIAISTTPGLVSKVGRRKINDFQGAPFSTATVINESAASGGRDEESDIELRQRIKDHWHSLSKGTETAIIRAVVGIADDEENKRVVSAFLRRPTDKNDPTILFIDDGTGFEPSFSGIGEEVIVSSASGTEQFLQLQKWPVVKAQLASVGVEPFILNGGESFLVEVDSITEEWVIPTTNFRSAGLVSAQEVAEALNKQFTTIEARAKEGRLFITPTAENPDWVRVGVSSLGTGDSNNAFRFPTRKQYTMRLYKNDILLEKNGSEAIIQSLKNSQWQGLSSSETLQLEIDGIQSSVITFTNADFATYTSSSTIANATVNDWTIMINRTFIGVTASAGDDGTFSIKSNRGFSSDASVAVFGGTLSTKLFPANSESIGKGSEYKLNRLLGQIELAERLEVGDEIKAGSLNTRGFALSSAQTNFNLIATNSLPAQMVILADAPFIEVPVLQSNTITFTINAAAELRIAGAAGQFSLVNENDYAHLYNTPRDGVLKVIDVAVDGSHVTFADPDPAAGSMSLNGVTNNINFFRTEGLPQLLTLPVGANVTVSDVLTAILAQISGVNAEILDSGSIKVETARYESGSALGLPSIVGSASNLGMLTGSYLSNDPHVASVESDDLTGIPSQRITIDTDDLVAPFDDLQADGTPFDTGHNNKQLVSYLGSSENLIRQPLIRLNSSDLTLRNLLPAPIVGIGQETKMTSLSGLEFGQADNMVFLIDNAPATKTFDVPMYVEGIVSGPSVPSTTEMDVLDLTGVALGTSLRWMDYKFDDYRAWYQASRNLPASNANSQMKITSVPFGPNGERVAFGFVYPSIPSSPASAVFTVEPTLDQIQISVTLESGDERLIGLLPNRRVDVEVSGNDVKMVFLPPVDLSQVQIGDIAYLSDVSFNQDNRGPMRVDSISSLTESGLAFEHLSEAITADVTSNTDLILSAAPSETVDVGDLITIGAVSRLVTVVNSQTDIEVESPGFTDGAAQAGTLIQKEITASPAPSFVLAAGDRLVIGSSVLIITNVISPTEFEVDSPFTFTGSSAGTLSRIFLMGTKQNPGTSEFHNVASSQSVRVYELATSANQSAALQAIINGTAGIKDLISASNSPANTGAGLVELSTEDELANGDRFVSLQNGESFVYSTLNASPAIRLKSALPVAPSIGDRVRFIPSNARNIADHFSKKQISGLSIAADIELVDQARRVQVSTKTPGGFGQVYAVGGRASGTNEFNIRGTAQETNSTRAQIELDKSAIELLAPGHTLKLSQTGRALKRFTGSTPIASTTVEVEVAAVGVGLMSLSVPFVTVYGYSQTGLVVWAVRNIGRNRIRFEILSGTATIPALVKADDWVLVGNGDTYAGITTDDVFAPANQGWFQIRETDNATYFDVDGQGVEQFIETSDDSFIFTPYHSARPGDQIKIAINSPLSAANQGTFDIISVPEVDQIIYANDDVEAEGPVVLGSSGTDSIGVLDQGYITYRKVVMVSPKPSDPTNRSIAVLSPGYDLSLISEGQSAKIGLPTRLGYGTDPVPGISGYSFWTGLKRKVQRVVDGYQPDTATFEGVGASGVSIEVREPQIARIQVSIKVKTSRGVSLQSLSDTLKNAISGYVNQLGLGQDVVISEIIRAVQEIPGVEAVVFAVPVPGTERIVVGDSSKARIAAADITLS